MKYIRKLRLFENLFSDCKSEKEAKDLHKKLSKENHPDVGGDVEKMKQINTDYDDYLNEIDRNSWDNMGFDDNYEGATEDEDETAEENTESDDYEEIPDGLYPGEYVDNYIDKYFKEHKEMLKTFYMNIVDDGDGPVTEFVIRNRSYKYAIAESIKNISRNSVYNKYGINESVCDYASMFCQIADIAIKELKKTWR
jgi:curved DNA-binding protein CbpA